MARTAKRTTDIPQHQMKVERLSTREYRRQTRRTMWTGVPFTEMTSEQKDALLEELAVRAGLIDDEE